MTGFYISWYTQEMGISGPRQPERKFVTFESLTEAVAAAIERSKHGQTTLCYDDSEYEHELATYHNGVEILSNIPVTGQ